MTMLPVSVLPATEADLPALARVETNAFADNPLGPLMFGPPTPDTTRLGVEEMAKTARTDPTARLTKAVVAGDRIVGYARWHFHSAGQQQQQQQQGEQAGNGGTAKQAMKEPPPTARSPEAFKEFFGSVAEKRDKFNVGPGFAVLQVLAVEPEYQGQGVGTALLQRGLEQAAQAGLERAWLEASEKGYPLYRKFGFKDVDEFTIDLAKYGETGLSKTVCMLRDAGE